MSDPTDEEQIAAWRQKQMESEREHLKHLEMEYQDSKNPLYIWQAIDYIRDHPELTAGDPQMFPPWVIEYLTRTARGISIVLLGMDYISTLAVENGGKLPPGGIWEVLARRIPPAERVQQCMEIFGFVSPGKNAFSEYDARTELVKEFVDYIGMLEDGMSSAQAIKELMEMKGTDDDRNIRRRIAMAKRRYWGEP